MMLKTLILLPCLLACAQGRQAGRKVDLGPRAVCYTVRGGEIAAVPRVVLEPEKASNGSAAQDQCTASKKRPLPAPRGYVREGVPAPAAQLDDKRPWWVVKLMGSKPNSTAIEVPVVVPRSYLPEWLRKLIKKAAPPEAPAESRLVDEQERLLNPPLTDMQLSTVARRFVATPGAMRGFWSSPRRVKDLLIGRVLGLPLSATRTEIAKVVLAKFAGIGIIVGSIGLKIPQIMTILNAKSCLGLSLLSNYFEVPLVSSTVIYHVKRSYAFSAYGENVFILIQNLAIVALMWKYAEPAVEKSTMVLISAAFFMVTAASWSLPDRLQPLLVLISTPLVVLVTVPQILINAKQGHTGHMNPVTGALKLIGSSIRLITTLIEIGRDKALLTSYGLGAVLNGVLVAQWWMTRDATAAAIGQPVVDV